MNLFIDSTSPVPVYRQIKNQIKGLILADSLEAGNILPSIRTLASYLEVANNTVARAYYELEKEGMIRLDGRRGSIVEDIDSVKKNDRKIHFLNELAEEFLIRSKEYGFSRDDIIRIIEEKYNDIY